MHALKRSSFWVAGALCLIVGVLITASVLTILTPNAAQAAGETYDWNTAGNKAPGTNIRASGGDYARAASLDLVEGDAFKGNLSGGITIKNYLPAQTGRPKECNYHMTINVNDNNASKAEITYLERNDDPGHSGCPTGPNLEQRWGGAIVIGNVPAGVPGHTTTGKPPIPEGCPGSSNPVTDGKYPAICKTIPAGCPGSLIAGPISGPDQTANCPYAGASEGGDQTDIDNPPPEEEETVKCTAESSFSWILCPILEMAVKGSTIIAHAIDGMLYVSPLSTEGGGAVIYSVWDNLRNLANVFLIIVMFVIIFSQATSSGISAYGVKSMIPKIVVWGILANMSFYICALSVDLFNVLGKGVEELVTSAAVVPIGEVEGATEEGGVQGALASMFSSGAVQGFLAVTGVVVIVLSGLWTGIVFAALVALLTLAARQALIVGVAIASAVACIAMILKSTEKIGKQIMELWWTALAMYPVLIVVFAGSRVAAAVLSGVEVGDDVDQNLRQGVAIFVAVTPLIATPALLKVGRFSLGAINRIAKGSRVGGFVKGLGQRQRQNMGARMAGAEWGENRGGVVGAALRGASRGSRFIGGYGARRRFKQGEQEKNAQRAQAAHVAGTVGASSTRPFSFARRASGVGGVGGAELARARGIETLDKLQGEEIKAAQTVLESRGMSGRQLQELAVNGTGRTFDGQTIGGRLYQRAAQGKLIREGRIPAVQEILRNAHNMDQDVRDSLNFQLGDAYSTLKGKAHGLNHDDIKTSIAQGTPITADDLQRTALRNMNQLNPEVFASQDGVAMEQLVTRVQDIAANPGSYSAAEIADAQRAAQLAQDAWTNNSAQKNFTPDARAHADTLRNISIAGAPAPAAAPAPAPPPPPTPAPLPPPPRPAPAPAPPPPPPPTPPPAPPAPPPPPAPVPTGPTGRPATPPSMNVPIGSVNLAGVNAMPTTPTPGLAAQRAASGATPPPPAGSAPSVNLGALPATPTPGLAAQRQAAQGTPPASSSSTSSSRQANSGETIILPGNPGFQPPAGTGSQSSESSSSSGVQRDRERGGNFGSNFRE